MTQPNDARLTKIAEALETAWACQCAPYADRERASEALKTVHELMAERPSAEGLEALKQEIQSNWNEAIENVASKNMRRARRGAGPANGNLSDTFDYWIAMATIDYLAPMLRLDNPPSAVHSEARDDLAAMLNRACDYLEHADDLIEDKPFSASGLIGDAKETIKMALASMEKTNG